MILEAFIDSESVFQNRDLPSATFATSSLEESARHIAQTCSHTIKPGANLPFVHLAHWRRSLERMDIDLVELDCGEEFHIGTDSEASRYIFQFPVQGACHFRVGRVGDVAGPGEMFVINPRQRAHKRWVGPCSQLMIQIDRNAFGQALSDELNEQNHRDPIIFEQFVQDSRVTTALRAIISHAWLSLSASDLLDCPRITKSIERTLLTSFLTVLRHNYSDDLNLTNTTAAPYYVKRAEEFIRAHLHDPIDMDDLVAVAGVSSRSLYYGFRRWRGTPPMSYLRNIRLALAHEKLKRAREEGSNVTQVALDVGYDHLSRFSKDYKDRYGVSPSATLMQIC